MRIKTPHRVIYTPVADMRVGDLIATDYNRDGSVKTVTKVERISVYGYTRNDHRHHGHVHVNGGWCYALSGTYAKTVPTQETLPADFACITPETQAENRERMGRAFLASIAQEYRRSAGDCED